MNEFGQVAGVSTDFQGRSSSFLYSDGRMTAIGSNLPHAINNVGRIASGDVYGLNNSGQTVGRDLNGHAYLEAGGVSTVLGELVPNGQSQAFAINEAGQIVGYATASHGTPHPFLYSDGRMIDLIPQAESNGWSANAINDSGLVVGGPWNGRGQGFLFDSSSGKMTFLGSLGGSGGESTALGINNMDQIVGTSNTSEDPVLTIPAVGSNHAFLYEAGQMLDLNNLIASTNGLILVGAVGINDRGQIAASAAVGDEIHAVLLNPMTVPEPSTLALAALVIVVVTACRMRPES